MTPAETLVARIRAAYLAENVSDVPSYADVVTDVEALCDLADRLREALLAIQKELGVVQPGYPAPVAAAAEIASAALLKAV